jgi:hypothetical protein
VKSRALSPQDRRVVLSNRVDGLVVDLRVLVHETVAEADDEACVRDARSERRVAAGKDADGLADDGELTLDRGADRPPRTVGLEVDSSTSATASQASTMSAR